MRFSEFKFTDTYYICSCVREIVRNPFGYLRFFDDIWCDGKVLNYVDGFSKAGNGLEIFISECIWKIYEELTAKVTEEDIIHRRSAGGPAKLTIEVLFDLYKIKYRPFMDAHRKDGLSPGEYFYEVDSEFHELNERLTKEVLNILFFDRHFLKMFNELLSEHLKEFVELHLVDNEYKFPDEFSCLFTSRGRLKRKCPPKWLRKAVYYREHGCCAICSTDLSGIFTNLKTENFDHIVPLDRFGSNDVSNIQMLCSQCNNSKRASSNKTSDIYVSVW